MPGIMRLEPSRFPVTLNEDTAFGLWRVGVGGGGMRPQQLCEGMEGVRAQTLDHLLQPGSSHYGQGSLREISEVGQLEPVTMEDIPYRREPGTDLLIRSRETGRERQGHSPLTDLNDL